MSCPERTADAQLPPLHVPSGGINVMTSGSSAAAMPQPLAPGRLLGPGGPVYCRGPHRNVLCLGSSYWNKAFNQLFLFPRLWLQSVDYCEYWSFQSTAIIVDFSPRIASKTTLSGKWKTLNGNKIKVIPRSVKTLVRSGFCIREWRSWTCALYSSVSTPAEEALKQLKIHVGWLLYS